MQKLTFAERAERTLIVAMLVGIVLVGQRWSFATYRVGLCVLIAATFLQIAVGNVPKNLSLANTLVRIVAILVLIVVLFGLGIILVPYFAQLGR